MAQLQWRPVEAPRLDNRDLALAGATVGGAFDRFATMLADREANLRKEATDAATADVLMADSPEALAAIRAKGLNNLGKRVDKAAFARSLSEVETDLLARTKTREEVLNIQAAGELGDEGVTYKSLLAEGKREEAKAFATQMAESNPLWGRVASGFHTDGEALFGDWDTRRMTGLRDAETGRHNKAEEGLAGQRNAIDAKRAAGEAQERQFRIRDMARREEALKQVTEATGMGERYGAALPASLSAEDATAWVRKSKTYNGFQGPFAAEQRAAFEKSVLDRFGRDTTATEADLANGGPTNTGVPAWMTPGAPKRSPSVQALTTEANAALSRSKVVQQGLTNRTMADNPYVQVFDLNAGYGDKQPDYKDVLAYANANTDMFMQQDSTLTEAKQKYGLTNGELMGLLQTMSFNSSLTQWGKQDAFLRHAEQYALARRDQGDIVKTKEELGNKLAPIQAMEAQLTKAMQAAQREAAKDKKVSAGTQAKIDSLTAQLRAMQLSN